MVSYLNLRNVVHRPPSQVFHIFTASKGSNLYLFNSISSYALLEIMFESFRDLQWSSLQSY